MSKFTLTQLSRPALLGASALAVATIGGTAYAAQRGEAMTRAEVQTRSSEHFAKMDVNKDGKLDAADRSMRQAAMFDRLDGNKDGSVSREEFTAARPKPEGARMGRRDGERREGGRRGGHGMRGGAAMLTMADANKDGTISQAEFTAASLAMFDRADANKDGTVTREERRAARAAMRPAAAPAT